LQEVNLDRRIVFADIRPAHERKFGFIQDLYPACDEPVLPRISSVKAPRSPTYGRAVKPIGADAIGKQRIGDFNDHSCVGSQKCKVWRTHNGHLPQIVGLVRLEIRILKEGQRVRRTIGGSCGQIFAETPGEKPVVLKSDDVRDFECNAVPGGGCCDIQG
jgi:hypothetical protein